MLTNVPGAPPCEDKPDEGTIDPQMPGLTGTSDPTKTMAFRQIVDGVENVGRKEYCKVTGLFNKYHKCTGQWNLWHPFWLAHNFQQVQLLSQQMYAWIDHHLRYGMDNFQIESFQSAGTWPKLLS
jgi:hypothetical protein